MQRKKMLHLLVVTLVHGAGFKDEATAPPPYKYKLFDVSAEPIKRCPEDYTLTASKHPVTEQCEYRESKPYNLRCPMDATRYMNDGVLSCRLFNELMPGWFCPEIDGFVEVNDTSSRANDPITCVRRVRRPGVEYCSGAEYEYNRETGLCSKNLTEPPSNYCHRGTLVEGECVDYVMHPITLTCKRGYELDFATSSCRKHMELAVDVVCPSGYTMADNNMCSRDTTVQSQPRCTAPFTLQNGTCVHVENMAPALVCDLGQLKGNHCISDTCMPPSTKCPSGFDQIADRCTRKKRVPAKNATTGKNDTALECTPGFEFADKHNCVGEEIIDPMKVCQNGFQMRGNECCDTTDQPAREECPYGFATRHGTCIKEETAEPSYICATGELVGKQCVSTNLLPPKQECQRGYSMVNSGKGGMKCINEDIAPIIKECKDGFIRSGDKCIEPIVVRAEKICTQGRLVTRNFEQICLLDLTMKAERKCPHGYAVGGEPSTVDYCHLEDFKRPIMTCPADYIMVEDMCRLAKEIQPERYCPSGYEIDGEVCRFRDIVPVTYDCPVHDPKLHYNPQSNRCEAEDIDYLIKTKKMVTNTITTTQEQLLDMDVLPPEPTIVIEPEVIVQSPKKFTMRMKAEDVVTDNLPMERDYSAQYGTDSGPNFGGMGGATNIFKGMFNKLMGR